MPVKQLPDGRWRATVCHTRPNKTLYRKTRMFSTKKDAENWLAEMRSVLDVEDLRAKTGIRAPCTLSLREFYLDWNKKQEYKVRHGERSGSTQASDNSRWRKWIEPMMGDLPLATITSGDILELKLRLEREGKHSRQVLVPLSAMFAEAVRRRLVDLNPVLVEGMGPIVRKKPVFHPIETVLAIANRWPVGDDRGRVAVLLAGLAALRKGEIVGLRPKDVHLEYSRGEGRYMRGWIEVANNCVRGAGGVKTYKAPKNGRTRKVPVCPTLADALRWYVKQGRATLLADPEGEPLRMDSGSSPIIRWLDLVQQELEVVPIGFHGLRKSAMAWWMRAKVTPYNVSAWAGHDEGRHMASVTRDHYTGEVEIDWEDAAKIEPPKEEG